MDDQIIRFFIQQYLDRQKSLIHGSVFIYADLGIMKYLKIKRS